MITGITGQDGSYLAELLLEKGYEVHGLIRRSSAFNTGRIEHLFQDPHDSPRRLILHYADMTDGNGISRLLYDVQPHEVYNLAAQSHVRVSFDQPLYTSEVTGLGTLQLLEAIRHYQSQTGNIVRMYQASSSELFGDVVETPQRETTPFRPRSPYAVAKAMAHWSCVNYRLGYDVFVACGILFNHESPRRGETFVTRKITRAATRIKLGLQSELYLGNLDAQRDWGFAGDYVEAMWLMLQQESPRDYVVATGETHSVREFTECAFAHLGLDYRQFTLTDPRYLRPTEVDLLLGDATLARTELGWSPKVDFGGLVKMMVEADLELAQRELAAQHFRK